MEDISTEQFEAIVTQRVLYRCLSASAIRNGFQRNDLLFKSSYTGSEVLQDYGLGEVCQCQMRGLKDYLFHKQNNRIVAELALAADTDEETGLKKRPQFYLINRNGFVKSQSLANLIAETGKLSNYEKHRR